MCLSLTLLYYFSCPKYVFSFFFLFNFVFIVGLLWCYLSCLSVFLWKSSEIKRHIWKKHLKLETTEPKTCLSDGESSLAESQCVFFYIHHTFALKTCHTSRHLTCKYGRSVCVSLSQWFGFFKIFPTISPGVNTRIFDNSLRAAWQTFHHELHYFHIQFCHVETKIKVAEQQLQHYHCSSSASHNQSNYQKKCWQSTPPQDHR